MTRLHAVAASLAATLLLAGCSSGHGDVELTPASGATAAGVALSPAVDHVHGAVVVDGALLLGTHSGLVEADPADGRTTLRGSSQDDLMGLAADGTTLVASGHPGAGSDLPDPLGLLRSDDGGQSWTPVSLTGEVDFHGLAMSGERVAGLGTADGPMVSEDAGRTWRTLDVPGATSLAWFDGTLWLATESGLRTPDGPAPSAPGSTARTLVLAAADDGSALWAVTGDGGVWRTVDGRAWQQHGAISALEALAATADTAYAVTADRVTAVSAP